MFGSKPVVGVDIGNGLWKAARYRHVVDDGEWQFFSDYNILQEIPEETYRIQVDRLKGSPLAQSFIRIKVKKEWYHYVVGEAAIRGGFVSDWRNQRVMKNAKWRRGYVGLAAAYQIVRLFWSNYEKLPAEVHVVTAHPPLDASVELREQIQKSVSGRWRFEIGGVDVDFEIGEVKVIDEITGGVRNVSLTEQGLPNYHNHLEGRRTLVVDIGDGTLDTAFLNKENVPESYESAEFGFFRCVQDFVKVFNHVHQKDYGDHAQTGINLDLVYSIFMDPEKVLRSDFWGGPDLPCGGIFDDVVIPYLDQMQTILNRMAGGNLLLSAPQVALTGGAGSLLFHDLAATVFAPYVNKDRNDLYLCGPANQRARGIYFNAMGLYKDGRAQARIEQADVK